MASSLRVTWAAGADSGVIDIDALREYLDLFE